MLQESCHGNMQQKEKGNLFDDWYTGLASLVKWLPIWRSASADWWCSSGLESCGFKPKGINYLTFIWPNIPLQLRGLYPDLSFQVMAEQEVPSSLALMGDGAVAQLFLIFLAMTSLKGFLEAPRLKWGFQNQFVNDKLKIVYSASFSADLKRSPLCPAQWWDKQIPPHKFLIPSLSLVGSLVSSFLCLSY